jgi:ankyrin repeat protein
MGEHELVEALLKAGANANFSNKFGNTALNELQLSEGTAESIGKITALLLEASLQSHHFGVSHDGWSVAHPITDDLSAFPNPNLVAF